MDGYKRTRPNFWLGYVKNIKRGTLTNGTVLTDVLFRTTRCMETTETN